jgi:tetrahydromethanopterin S-methyltransferase subunit G
MEENRLDNELERIHKKLPFLWENYDFHVKYFTRDYGMYYRGFVIGLENDICKLVFEKETNSQNELIRDYVGKRSALFAPPNYSYFAEYDWYSLTGLIYWLSGVEYEYDKDIDKDLENLSGYLKLHMDKVLDLFKSPDEFDRKLEYYRNLHKDNQITVEKIRAERARLQALGQDWSLEAAIASLRGGKK